MDLSKEYEENNISSLNDNNKLFSIEDATNLITENASNDTKDDFCYLSHSSSILNFNHFSYDMEMNNNLKNQLNKSEKQENIEKDLQIEEIRGKVDCEIIKSNSII